MRMLWPLILLGVALCLAGCSGERTHDVVTPGDGSLRGLELSPEPQTLSISTGEEFYLDWRDGYEPPSEFHVTLRSIDPDGSTTAIYTDLRTFSTGHYRLEPTMSLPAKTFLLLQVTGAGETVRAMYLTEEGGYFGLEKRSEGKGQAEHTVKVK